MPQNLWNAQEAAALPDLDGLVYRSNLLGRDRAVVNIYGGNTSSKLMLPDHMSRETEVLAVKASGSDVLTIVARQFALLRMADIYPLFDREAMTDEEMIDYLSFTAFEPGRPRQSIETLLHAFVPHKHVDHTHPDAVISLACAPDGEAVARDLWGDRMAWVPYIRPGFTLSKWIGGKVRDNPNIECVVMGKHGLVTWGEESKSTYDHTIAVIQEAEDYIKDKANGKRVFGAVKVAPLDAEQRREIAIQIMPVIRGAVSDRRSAILAFDDDPKVLDYVSYERTPEVSQVGAACPDHLVHVKPRPLFVQWDPSEGVDALIASLPDQIEQYKQGYAEYFEANKSDGDVVNDPSPRVILVPGVGMINTGSDAQNADVSRQLYHRAVDVIAGSEAVGGFNSLTPSEAFAIEYWPLELYKLRLKPPPRELAGKVVLITGAASGIGRATALRLAKEDAHVIITDINAEAGRQVADEISKRHGHKRGLFLPMNVTDEAAVVEAFRQAVLAYGGVDVVINNAGIAGGAPITETSLADWNRNQSILATGYFLVAREAFRVLKAQGRGGSLVFVASKNSIVAGKGASAYSAAKAAEIHLARCLAEEGGEHGIRVNSVLPDAVIQGSSIWDSEWKEARAKNYGIGVDELQDFYAKRNTLKVAVLPDDIAEAILFFAGPRSAKTTGGMITVDGGQPAAYVR
ncbi:MAG TPA: bifunctional aldolase/short-chain dehydrogenase [Aggregatilinea sp.]|uniref:bifunctional aldolase/short-chain dehydrogenase n=1 Tax=Aggregatilinea sp. TaxID=2806333 RepID=UPI002CDF3999|nr:bifunctional aldolase/short-chain dehydrogenase [Aggregatilinea sp.]HML21896.1 bifunctional aldolase/short-chain dehydrogenase [Aggregatilinea sp.]